MKKFFYFILLLSVPHSGLLAQVGGLPAMDKSALDISYHPSNYPILKIQDKTKEPLIARVIYSRPLKAGRSILGDLVEYGVVWRLGANEATELELFRDAKIGSTPVKKRQIYTLRHPGKGQVDFHREPRNRYLGCFQIQFCQRCCQDHC
jgi:hypothetical protein